MKTLILSLTFVVGASLSAFSAKAETKKTEVPPTSAPVTAVTAVAAVAAVAAPSPRQTYPKNQQIWNDDLYQILIQLGLKEVYNNKSPSITLMDVDCILQMQNPLKTAKAEEEPFTRCEFSPVLKSGTKGKRIKSSKGHSATAEKLRSLLSDFPISQGDSGVSTPYLKCEKVNKASKEASCHIAILLNYEGP